MIEHGGIEYLETSSLFSSSGVGGGLNSLSKHWQSHSRDTLVICPFVFFLPLVVVAKFANEGFSSVFNYFPDGKRPPTCSP